MGRGCFLRTIQKSLWSIPKKLVFEIHLSREDSLSFVGGKCYFRTPLDFNDYFLSTAVGFLRVINNAILTSRIQIEFLSTWPGSDSLSLKIIRMIIIIIIINIPTLIMIDKMSWGEKEGI